MEEWHLAFVLDDLNLAPLRSALPFWACRPCGQIGAAYRTHLRRRSFPHRLDTSLVKHMRAWQLHRFFYNHLAHAYRAFRARVNFLDHWLRPAQIWSHTVVLVAALLPVLGLALCPAVAHELATGARPKDGAAALRNGAVGALPTG